MRKLHARLSEVPVDRDADDWGGDAVKKCQKGDDEVHGVAWCVTSNYSMKENGDIWAPANQEAIDDGEDSAKRGKLTDRVTDHLRRLEPEAASL